MESSLLEAAEARATEVEAGGDELDISLLQNILDHLRGMVGRDREGDAV